MKGLKFSLLQLVVSVGIILLVFLLLITFVDPQPSTAPTQQPIPSIPFQNLKMK